MTPEAKRLMRDFGPLFGAYVIVRALFTLHGPIEVKVALALTAAFLVTACFGVFEDGDAS